MDREKPLEPWRSQAKLAYTASAQSWNRPSYPKIGGELKRHRVHQLGYILVGRHIMRLVTQHLRLNGHVPSMLSITDITNLEWLGDSQSTDFYL